MTEYKKDHFEDRKLKYEKNHGVFIHEFMFTEFSNRILGQCNVALNDLQRQLDLEIARAKAEEKRLDQKIDAETTRATAEEKRLNGKIDEKLNNNLYNYLPKTGGGMNPRSLISWDFDLGDTSFGTVGGLKWSGAEDYISITGEASNIDDMNLVVNMGTNNSNAIVFKNPVGNEVASIHTNGEYTGSIDWDHIKNRPEIILTPNGYKAGKSGKIALNGVLDTSFSTIATALNQINNRLNALENK